jgi:cobyrinic acid a,c-diamide synthase
MNELQASDAEPLPAHTSYLISAPWRSSGKTLVSIGLAHEAFRQQRVVQTYKKGPDYIDPLWLTCASGRPCYNLDLWFQQPEELCATYGNHIEAGALALVEGTMGLHDGLQTDGSDSNAAVAKLLGSQVILVVDCRGMHRTIAALINGLQQFDSQVNFAGVILNRIRSARHGEKIRAALQQYCEMPVLGEIPETRGVRIVEKELGLTPAPEFASRSNCIEMIADLVRENCDISSLMADVAMRSSQGDPRSAESLPIVPSAVGSIRSLRVSTGQGLRIGIAKDEAFHFYYQDDLDQLRSRGAELIEVSPLRDDFPDALDGMLIGGGFPERHANLLMQNVSFREGLLSAIQSGLAVHAECAGLMYLCKHLLVDGESFDMVGVFDAEVTMQRKPVGRGYGRLRHMKDGVSMVSHEFHHSSIRFNKPTGFVYAVERGFGIDGHHDGVVYRNAYAGYSHFRHTRATPWIDGFLARIGKEQCQTQADIPEAQCLK